jgi:hypothetical protein
LIQADGFRSLLGRQALPPSDYTVHIKQLQH